jgi:phosphotransacetylase
VKTFSQAIKIACLISAKPTLAIAPAHDGRLLSLLPDLCRLVSPLLIGRAETIQDRIFELGMNPVDFKIIDEKDEESAIVRAMRLIKEDRAKILMEAGMDHDLFMHEVFRTRHRRSVSTILSHVSIVEFPLTRKCAIITDTTMNPAPGLKEKIAVLHNALSVARAIGRARPKVAALAALEYVNPSMPSTIDAAVLSKMAQRGQFGDTKVEGPLDIDCAVSKDACTRKGVKSEVTGDVDIFLVPDVESGSCFVQFLSVFGNMPVTGFVVGSPAPVILKTHYTNNPSAIAGVAFAGLMVRR